MKFLQLANLVTNPKAFPNNPTEVLQAGYRAPKLLHEDNVEEALRNLQGGWSWKRALWKKNLYTPED